jgi:hypothetical protein
VFRSRDPGLEKSRIQDEHPGLYFRELRNSFWVKFFDAIRIRDLFDPGFEMEFGSGILVKHPGSATLLYKTQLFMMMG